MKTGLNLLLWASHVTEEHFPILKALKKVGYDSVEIPIFEGHPDHYAMIGAELDRLGLERSSVSVIGPAGKNPLSSDKQDRQAAVDYTNWAIDCTAALGAGILGGPMHSEIGSFTGNAPTPVERGRGVSFHRKVGDYAARKNVRFALEALNRFECYFLNTMAQLADYLDEVDHPAVKAMYDTFHANIEEKDPVAAIKTIKRQMTVVRRERAMCPGLKPIGHCGPLAMTTFSRSKPLAARCRQWLPPRVSGATFFHRVRASTAKA